MSDRVIKRFTSPLAMPPGSKYVAIMHDEAIVDIPCADFSKMTVEPDLLRSWDAALTPPPLVPYRSPAVDAIVGAVMRDVWRRQYVEERELTELGILDHGGES